VSPLSTNPGRFDVALMLALTFSTGIVDAVGFVAFDQIFAANMTGNLVVMGIGAVGAAPVAFWAPLCAVFAFASGAGLTGLLLRRGMRGWTRRSTIAFGGTAVALLAVAAWDWSGLTAAGDLRHAIAAAALGFAMGVQTAAARRVGVVDVNTVVVTLTLAGFFMESAAAVRPSRRMQLRRVTAVVLMTGGAACGAALTQWGSWAGLLAAAGIVLLVTGIGHLQRAVHSR